MQSTWIKSLVSQLKGLSKKKKNVKYIRACKWLPLTLLLNLIVPLKLFALTLFFISKNDQTQDEIKILAA